MVAGRVNCHQRLIVTVGQMSNPSSAWKLADVFQINDDVLFLVCSVTSSPKRER